MSRRVPRYILGGVQEQLASTLGAATEGTIASLTIPSTDVTQYTAINRLLVICKFDVKVAVAGTTMRARLRLRGGLQATGEGRTLALTNELVPSENPELSENNPIGTTLGSGMLWADYSGAGNIVLGRGILPQGSSFDENVNLTPGDGTTSTFDDPFVVEATVEYSAADATRVGGLSINAIVFA